MDIHWMWTLKWNSNLQTHQKCQDSQTSSFSQFQCIDRNVDYSKSIEAFHFRLPTFGYFFRWNSVCMRLYWKKYNNQGQFEDKILEKKLFLLDLHWKMFGVRHSAVVDSRRIQRNKHIIYLLFASLSVRRSILCQCTKPHARRSIPGLHEMHWAGKGIRWQTRDKRCVTCAECLKSKISNLFESRHSVAASQMVNQAQSFRGKE